MLWLTVYIIHPYPCLHRVGCIKIKCYWKYTLETLRSQNSKFSIQGIHLITAQFTSVNIVLTELWFGVGESSSMLLLMYGTFLMASYTLKFMFGYILTSVT